MRIRLMLMTIPLSIIAAGALLALVAPPSLEAQGVPPELITGYLERTGLAWKRDDKDRDTFRVSKTSGLKRASSVEVVVTNIPNKSMVTLRAFGLAEGKYLGLSRVTDQQGLMKDMLSRNATAFGAYFLDDEGDIGFRFIFTTESGLGYPSFKAVLDELLRIADEVSLSLYQKYR